MNNKTKEDDSDIIKINENILYALMQYMHFFSIQPWPHLNYISTYKQMLFTYCRYLLLSQTNLNVLLHKTRQKNTIEVIQIVLSSALNNMLCVVPILVMHFKPSSFIQLLYYI